MELKKVKNKNQETDGYGGDKRPETEKLNDNWKLEKKTETEKSRKAVRVSVKSVFVKRNRRSFICFILLYFIAGEERPAC